MDFQHQIGGSEGDEIIRLLANGAEIPQIHLKTIKTPIGPFVKIEDITDLLRDLEEVTISDQKQEAFKGLRKLLKHLR